MDHTGPAQTGGPGETADTVDANRAALVGPPPAPQQGLSPLLSGTQPTGRPTALQPGAGPVSVVTPKNNSSDKQTANTESVETSTGSTQDTFHGNQIDAVPDHGAAPALAAGTANAVTQDTARPSDNSTGTDQELPPRLIHSESSPAALESTGMDHPARTGTADSGNRSPVADTTNTHLPIPRPQRTLPASVGSSPEATAGNVAAVQEGSNGGENSGMNSPRGQHDIAERSPGGRYVRFLEKLGSGAYKDVYRAFDTIEGIEVAWNVVTLAGVPKTERSRIVNEVRLLERLHHNNIISFHGSWVNREKEQVIFVTEILSSGTLKSFINKVQVIRWKIAKRWAIQILNGLQYLHSYDPPIIHRDLKCDNIFINGTTGDLRIGDLGLSTMVSNKNKALSVLGTPEFMAPELYDEVYDEKIDIYAFGMCLLEIFTKEVPYSECSNPAQIFKKVTKDIPPQSLGRVRNSDARDFIKLCLGIRNEQGAYPRPSAKELLQHPFLARGENDESEVEVDPPLSSIVEGQWSGDRESNSSNITQHTRAPSDNDLQRVATESSEIKLQNGHEAIEATRERPLSSAREMEAPDESDHFSSMPDSELNMKKIKVLMGRGQEINDDENDGRPPRPVAPVGVDISAVTTKPAGNPMRSDSESESDSGAVREPGSQYLVAAAVIHEEGTGQKPYPNDVLKLVITLPVEGQTQNVEFDFHLVEDDAVQVAREMVSELHIPESTVLEISEIISRLARDARMKQEKYNQQQRQWQQQQQLQSSSVIEHQHAPNVVALEPAQSQQSFSHQGGAPIENGTHNIQMNSSMAQHSPQYFDGGGAPVSAQEMTTVQPIVIQENTAAVHQHLTGPIHQAGTSFSPVTEDGQNHCDSDEESESPNSEELKKLEDEFQKNLSRATKAFDTRMDNLHRSKEEREAQHLKILEKHEKEKAEFEKRILQAEAEKTRRLDQLQKEWTQQRESLVKQNQEDSTMEKRQNSSLESAYTPSTPPYPNSVYAENGSSVYPMNPAPSAGAVVTGSNDGMRRNVSVGSNGSEIRYDSNFH